MLAHLIDIRTITSSELGDLSFFESPGDLPFDIKRIYYIYNVPIGVRRGMHAHINLQQLLVCLNGSIEIILDNGAIRESVMLDNPSKGLIVESMTWREMVWHEAGSILMVAASSLYDENDYIRDYDLFLKKASIK